ncbi:hypothetical protein TNCV_1649361 [Trichonephila clavipes]|nr:hypothetical protein TNCV_1649361 [Trichonephila clavipes]
MQGKAILRVRMAERSKALRSGRVSTSVGVGNTLPVSGWPSGLRRCVQVAVHLCGRWVRIPLLTMYFFQSFFEVKNYMQGKAILRVRMAERSKALRSGRSPLLWAWDFQAVKGAAFMSKSTRFWRGHFFEVKNFMQGKAILRVRMAERSKALRSGRSPGRGLKTKCKGKLFCVSGWPSGLRRCVQVAVHFWAWVQKLKCKGKLFHVSGFADRSKALRLGHIPLLWAWSFFEVKNYMQGKAILRVRMAERSKALRSGRSPLLWAWAGQAVKGAAFMSKSTRFWRGLRFLSGLKRSVQVAVKFCRRGFGFHV